MRVEVPGPSGGTLIHIDENLDTCRKLTEGRARMDTAALRLRQEAGADRRGHVIRSMQPMLQPQIYAKMLLAWDASEKYMVISIPVPDGDAADGAMQGWWIGTTITPATIDAGKCVQVTMSSCSAGCVRNTGLPCEHLFALFRRLPNFNAVPVDLVDPFYRVPGSEDSSDSEEDVFVDASSAGADDYEPGGPPEPPAAMATTRRNIPAGDRWGLTMAACRQVCEMARWSTAACEEAIALIEGVAQTLADKYSQRPEAGSAVDATTGQVILNPVLPGARGRPKRARVRGAANCAPSSRNRPIGTT